MKCPILFSGKNKKNIINSCLLKMSRERIKLQQVSNKRIIEFFVFIISPKPYIVGTHRNCLSEADDCANENPH